MRVCRLHRTGTIIPMSSCVFGTFPKLYWKFWIPSSHGPPWERTSWTLLASTLLTLHFAGVRKRRGASKPSVPTQSMGTRCQKAAVGRADRAPGECLAGEGCASRRDLTGRCSCWASCVVSPVGQRFQRQPMTTGVLPMSLVKLVFPPPMAVAR